MFEVFSVSNVFDVFDVFNEFSVFNVFNVFNVNAEEVAKIYPMPDKTIQDLRMSHLKLKAQHIRAWNRLCGCLHTGRTLAGSGSTSCVSNFRKGGL